jgi:multiple sugar transport system substrate-binding protein
MQENSTFQLIVKGVFIAALVLGVVSFALYRGSEKAKTGIQPVAVWGIVDEYVISNVLLKLNEARPEQLVVNYRKIPRITFADELTRALADGTQPDILLLPQEDLFQVRERIQKIPFENLSARTYQDTYADIAQFYVDSEGIAALPVAVDPLVMYWNRDIVREAGILTPATTWNSLTSQVKSLTKKSTTNTLEVSAIALGGSRNVTNAKEVWGLLNMQLGGSFIRKGMNAEYEAALLEVDTSGYIPSQRALQFYTSFVDPVGDLFTWSRTLPSSQVQFASGKVAYYIGYASEATKIREINPNLNFDVTFIPQFEGQARTMTYGKLYGLSVLKKAPQFASAFQMVSILASQESGKVIADELGLPSARRDSLGLVKNDPYQELFDKSAVYAVSWWDPQSTKTNEIILEMIDNVTSGRATARAAVEDANRKLQILLSTTR